LQANASVGCFFDEVTSHFIKVGEALFIDYGKDWHKLGMPKWINGIIWIELTYGPN